MDATARGSQRNICHMHRDRSLTNTALFYVCWFPIATDSRENLLPVHTQADSVQVSLITQIGSLF
jgi:hypothetical protein